ncbi:hypothetical protein PBY51_020805 [Eleginops maclovinus]|uniref:Uncharacterized protein n=1 Tax=Eleginops maclovinus TaxID=56733 RepID=A0AAN7XU43_ELEMC|nr:hypothetical protein PBY51_020805 [Eleginops maclovinus]
MMKISIFKCLESNSVITKVRRCCYRSERQKAPPCFQVPNTDTPFTSASLHNTQASEAVPWQYVPLVQLEPLYIRNSSESMSVLLFTQPWLLPVFPVSLCAVRPRCPGSEQQLKWLCFDASCACPPQQTRAWRLRRVASS